MRARVKPKHMRIHPSQYICGCSLRCMCAPACEFCPCAHCTRSLVHQPHLSLISECRLILSLSLEKQPSPARKLRDEYTTVPALSVHILVSESLYAHALVRTLIERRGGRSPSSLGETISCSRCRAAAAAAIL